MGNDHSWLDTLFIFLTTSHWLKFLDEYNFGFKVFLGLVQENELIWIVKVTLIVLCLIIVFISMSLGF